MKEELCQKLYQSFPYFDYEYGDHKGQISLECGDGWFDIIYRMCEKIKKTGLDDDLRFMQVKEKYATLRVYDNGSVDEVFDIISDVERDSAEICEECGSFGRVRTWGSWYYTKCDNCWAELMKKRGIKENENNFSE